MKNFDYVAPRSLAEATAALAAATGTARVLAGGTDLIVQLRERLRDADIVVDVKHIPELMELSISGSGLRLGASVPCYRIYEHEAIVRDYPGLVDAARIVGGWQIQSRASVGGNLCNSSPAGDTLGPLIALNAKCVIAGAKGTRTVSAESFCLSPSKNVLQKDEILVRLEFPPQSRRSGSAYQRFIPRNEMDIAVAGVASWVELDDSCKTVVNARIGVAAVAPTARFASEASDWLRGQPVSESTFAHAGELAIRVASPIDDMRGTAEFRRHLVGVLTKRTLALAVQRAQSRTT